MKERSSTVRGIGGPLRPCAPPRKLAGRAQHPHQLGDGDGRHAEIVAGEPQRRHADHRGDADAHRHAERRARRSAASRDGCRPPPTNRRRRRRTPHGRPTPGRHSRRRCSTPRRRSRPAAPARPAAVDRRVAGQQRIDQHQHETARAAGCGAMPLISLAHQALRPEPQDQHEQHIDDDVLVDRADQIGRQRFDDADQQPGDQRA